MKILLIAPHPFFQNRGTPIAVKLLAETLAGIGHRITILTFPEGEDISHENISIQRISSFAKIKDVKPGLSWKKIVYDFFLFLKFKSLIKETQFDIIHAVEESAFFALFAKKTSGIPYIYDMDSSLAEQIVERFSILNFMLPILRGFENAIINNCLGVIPVCKALEDIVKRTNASPLVQRLEDISLIPSNMVEVELDPRVEDVEQFTIMYIGNLEGYQGIDLLLEAFCEARKREIESRLIIIGGSEQDIHKYIKRSRELGLDKSTIFLGPKPIEQMAAYFLKADLLVSPRTKGFNTPMKIYSYLDSGKPVLATNLPTHTQVLDNEISFLAEPNPGDFARSMVEIMKNPEKSASVARLARERVKREFSVEAYHRKLSGFYKEIEKLLGKE